MLIKHYSKLIKAYKSYMFYWWGRMLFRRYHYSIITVKLTWWLPMDVWLVGVLRGQRYRSNFTDAFFKIFCELIAPVKLFTGEYHVILLMISHHRCRKCHGVVKQQAITRANVDLDLCLKSRRMSIGRGFEHYVSCLLFFIVILIHLFHPFYISSFSYRLLQPSTFSFCFWLT